MLETIAIIGIMFTMLLPVYGMLIRVEHRLTKLEGKFS